MSRSSTASGKIRRCSFYEEATICVVLVPVWSDDTKFERMARLLKRIDVVNVRELLRSGSPWVSGIIRLRYVDYAVVQSDWDAFQGFRKVLGVCDSFLLSFRHTLTHSEWRILKWRHTSGDDVYGDNDCKR